MESIKKEDVLPKREIVHDTTLLLDYLKLCPKLALYFPEEWITEKNISKNYVCVIYVRWNMLI